MQDVNEFALSPMAEEFVSEPVAQAGSSIGAKYYPVMLFHFPLMSLFALSRQKQIILLDVRRWLNILGKTAKSDLVGLLFLLTLYPEFRSLYYYRAKKDHPGSRILIPILQVIYHGCPALYIWAREIGPGLFIQHGFSTVIAADTIGENCWINQQVTIGFNDVNDRPVIGNNVQITAGAKVLGAIKVGNNVKVGANAVVVKNVPDNCTVVGVPAYIVKLDGVKVHQPLS